MAGAAHHHRVGRILEELLLQRSFLVLLLFVDLIEVRHGRAREGEVETRSRGGGPGGGGDGGAAGGPGPGAGAGGSRAAEKRRLQDGGSGRGSARHPPRGEGARGGAGTTTTTSGRRDAPPRAAREARMGGGGGRRAVGWLVPWVWVGVGARLCSTLSSGASTEAVGLRVSVRPSGLAEGSVGEAISIQRCCSAARMGVVRNVCLSLGVLSPSEYWQPSGSLRVEGKAEKLQENGPYAR